MKAPWEFTTTPSPSSGVPNVPTPEGRALGKELARLTDLEAAQHPEMPDRCDDCALRAGTDPNGCAGTLMDITKCSMEGTPFFCHKDGRLCRGYALIRVAVKPSPREAG